MKIVHALLVAMLSFGVVASGAQFDSALAAKKAKKKATKKKEEPAPVADPNSPLPDLVILPAETIVQFGGCGVNDLLISGTVAIKNQGKGREGVKLSSALIATYIAENLDMKDEDIVLNSLKQYEIVTKDIEIGKGKLKDGRNFKGKRTVYVVVDPYNVVEESNENNNLIKRELTMSCK